jgi:sialate O-acetylesterase
MVLQMAPSSAAVFGTVALHTKNVTITVTDGAGATYSVAAVVHDGLWKALLRPAPAGGNYSITAIANGTLTVTLSSVAFGDVWYCGGQSNMALPLLYTLSRNVSLAAISSGLYTNIRIMQMSGNMNPTTQWMTVSNATTAVDKEGVPLFMRFSATCYYFAESLTDALGAAAPPLGLIHTAFGGSTIQQWLSNDTLNSGVCANATSPQGGEGMWHDERVLPFSELSLKGWLWYQVCCPRPYGCPPRKIP